MHKANNDRYAMLTRHVLHRASLLGFRMTAVGLNLFNSYKNTFVYHIVGVSLQLSRPTHAASTPSFSQEGAQTPSPAQTPPLISVLPK